MSREAVLGVAAGSTGNRSLLRRMNSLGILRAVLSGPQTMRVLAAESGLSRTAVDAIVGDLVELGWITSAEGAPGSRVGRPASAWGLRPNLGHLLSLDVGANHVYVVVTNLAGEVSGRRSVKVQESLGADDRIAAAVLAADELLAELGLTRDDLWVVAIGSPGAVSGTGTVLHFGGTGMPGWAGLNLRERFGAEFNTVIVVEGDVALGAQAELSFGAARGHRDVVYVLCGTRTSGASIVDGRVHRGVHGAAGIVGEMPELKWTELNERYGAAVLSEPRPSREDIFEAARAGDPAALAAVQEFADDLATGAAALTLAVDPELLVIGGGSAPGADVFLKRFEATLRAICPLPPVVAVSELGSDAVAMGGVSVAFDRMATTLETAVRQRDAFPSPRETLDLLTKASVES